MADFPLNYPECCATVASDTSVKKKQEKTDGVRLLQHLKCSQMIPPLRASRVAADLCDHQTPPAGQRSDDINIGCSGNVLKNKHLKCFIPENKVFFPCKCLTIIFDILCFHDFISLLNLQKPH